MKRPDVGKIERPAPRLAAVLGATLAVVLVTTAGCRQGLYDQAKYEPFEASALYADGTSARPLPAHTVARDHLRQNVGYFTGKDETGEFVTAFPMEVTLEVLERGQERFNIFCSPCHGLTGAGNGMIVQRGYKRPATYLEDWVLFMPVGFFVNAMTEGYGVMPSYASQVPPDDRWAIAAYIKVLQAARNVPVSELTPDQQEVLAQIPATTGAPNEARTEASNAAPTEEPLP